MSIKFNFIQLASLSWTKTQRDLPPGGGSVRHFCSLLIIGSICRLSRLLLSRACSGQSGARNVGAGLHGARIIPPNYSTSPPAPNFLRTCALVRGLIIRRLLGGVDEFTPPKLRRCPLNENLLGLRAFT